MTGAQVPEMGAFAEGLQMGSWTCLCVRRWSPCACYIVAVGMAAWSMMLLQLHSSFGDVSMAAGTLDIMQSATRNSTTIIYVTGISSHCRQNLKLYCQLLADVCQNQRLKRENQAAGQRFHHVFIVEPQAAEQAADKDLISAAFTSCYHLYTLEFREDFSQALFESSHQHGFQPIVVTSCQQQGPLIPKYFWHTGCEFWADAYTSPLRHGAQFVASRATCDHDTLDFGLPWAVHKDFAEHVSRRAANVSDRRKAWRILKRAVVSRVSSGVPYELLHGGSTVSAMNRSHTARSECSQTSQTYPEHVWETLFHPGPGRLPRFYAALSRRVAKQEDAPLVTAGERILVVVAFYEKDAEYRANMLHFMQVCVIPDAQAGAPLDYVIVVNGETTVTFPKMWNLLVISRPNTCFDFGSWGIGLRKKTPRHKTFIVLNPTVMGPFLPKYFMAHWSSALVSLLTQKVRLVGTSMNCPDGVGRSLVHVMSMVMAFDEVALHIGMAAGIFDCAADKRAAMFREGDFAQLLRKSGFSAEALQASHSGTEWFRLPKHPKHRPPSGPSSQCPQLPNDVFFSAGRYFGMTAHPIEFVFYKTTRHIPEAMPILKTLSSQTATKVVDHKFVAVLSHSFQADGAPRALLDLSTQLVLNGLHVHAVGPDHGPLEAEYADWNITASVVPKLAAFWVSETFDFTLMDVVLDIFGDRVPVLVICNTILWTRAIHRLPRTRSSYPMFVWFIHEHEITANAPGLLPNTFWYGNQFSELDVASCNDTVSNADAVIFPADATRALWSSFDRGHLHTLYNFVRVSRVTSGAGLTTTDTTGDLRGLRTIRSEVRSEFGFPADTFIMSALGSICERKNQLKLLEPGVLKLLKERFSNNWLILLAGKNPKADRVTPKMVVKAAEAAGVSQNVRLIKFGPKNLRYVAAADLHISLSWLEVSPLNTLEAKVLGIPVLMTPAGGSHEQVIADQVDGYLLPDFETASFVKALRRIIFHPQALAEMGETWLAFDCFVDVIALGYADISMFRPFVRGAAVPRRWVVQAVQLL